MTHFKSFQYGRPLDHLQPKDVLRICETVGSVSTIGAKMVISVLFMYCYNNEEHWMHSKALIRKLLQTKGLLEYSEEANIDKHQWSDLCERCLKDHDEELAEHLISDIIDLCSGNSFISSVDSELKGVCKILLTQFFDVVWPKLSAALLLDKDQYFVFYSLKSILESHINSYGPEKGVFGDQEKILQWCR